MKILNVDMSNNPDYSKCLANLKKDSYFFLYFRSEAEFKVKSTKCFVSERSVVISDYKPEFISGSLPDGYAAFKPDFSDFSYIENLGIKLNKAVKIYDDSIIYELLRCLCIESVKNSEKSDEFAVGALKLIFIKISDIIASDEIYSVKSQHYKYLLKLRENIYSHPFEKVDIDSICMEMCIGKTYFHRIYLAYFGTTYIQDVINSKLEIAKKMLVETSWSVSAIAEKCGYESDSYFMRQFKKHTGITPTEYRRKYSV